MILTTVPIVEQEWTVKKMANKHKPKLDHKCQYLTRYRQIYQHKGYNQPAEYCTDSYSCTRPGVSLYPNDVPHCEKCIYRKEKK